MMVAWPDLALLTSAAPRVRRSSFSAFQQRAERFESIDPLD
jgi:hypothetical protein